jgi:hypothetical protein
MIQVFSYTADIVFVSFIAFVIGRYKVQRSISENYYKLRADNLGNLFTLFCVGFAFPVAMLASDIFITPAAMLICLVGVSRAFKESKLLRFFHMSGAYVGVVLSQIGICISYDMWYITVAFFSISGILFLLKVKNKIFWVEILAFLSIRIVLINFQ